MFLSPIGDKILSTRTIENSKASSTTENSNEMSVRFREVNNSCNKRNAYSLPATTLHDPELRKRKTTSLQEPVVTKFLKLYNKNKENFFKPEPKARIHESIHIARLNSPVPDYSGSFLSNRQNSSSANASTNLLAYHRGGADTNSSGTPEPGDNDVNHNKKWFSRMDSRFSDVSNYSESNEHDYDHRHGIQRVAKRIEEMHNLEDATTPEFIAWHVAADVMQAQAISNTRFKQQPHITTNTVLVMSSDDQTNFLREIKFRNHSGFYGVLPGTETFYTSLQQYHYMEVDRTGAVAQGQAYLAYNVTLNAGYYQVSHLAKITTDSY